MKRKITQFLRLFVAVGLLLLGSGKVAATVVTYTISAKTSAGVTSGTAPTGSAVSYTQTYTNVSQSTAGNTATMTLTGYAGYRIIALSFSTHSNASKGGGSMTVTAGTTQLLKIDGAYNAAWSGAYTNSYETITPAMSNASYAIQTDESVVIKLAANANSLYWESVTVTYESSSAAFAPTFDLAAGTYVGAQNVTINSATAGATIYYTTDGKDPTTSSELIATGGAVSIASSCTLKAMAVKSGFENSSITSAAYTITPYVEAPTLPANSTFSGTYSLTIPSVTDCTVYYTTDGSDPTTSGTAVAYSAAIALTSTTTVKAVSKDADDNYSDVVTATYTKAYTLAEAKALYVSTDVSGVLIDLTGVQVVAQKSNTLYVQQGTTGMMLYGTSTPTYIPGTTFTAGTVTGTVTLYNASKELKSAVYANVTTTSGTLTSSATISAYSDIASSYSTYESRYITLPSLTFDGTGKIDSLRDGTHSIAVYDIYNLIPSGTTIADPVVVKGCLTAYVSSSKTTYEIIPVSLSDISTGLSAGAVTCSVTGGATSAEAVAAITVVITPAASSTLVYAVNDGTPITSTVAVTMDITEDTKLEFYSTRDFYVDTEVITYYYKVNASAPHYTLNYYENGASAGNESLVENATITHTPATTPAGYTFMGWTTAEYSNATTAPTYVTKATDDMDLYAVYANEGYYLVESSSDLGSGDYSGYYLISTSPTVFMDGASTTPGNGNVSVNPGSELIGNSVSVTWGDAHHVQFNKVGTSGYTMLAQSGVYYYTTGTSSNSTSTNKSTAEDNLLSLSVDANGKAVISKTKQLMYNSGTTSFFRFYATTSTYDAIYLYKKGIRNYTTLYSTLSVGSLGYATYCNAATVAIPDGVEAYYCTTTSETATMHTVHTAIPAAAGVILKAPEGTYTFAVTNLVNSDDLTSNALVGYTAETPVTPGTNESYYRLSYVDAAVGFYPAAIGGTNPNAAFTAAAGKAYLKITGSSSIKSFRITFDDDNTTGIDSVINENVKGDSTIFDLTGRKVTNPTRGIYVVNGKKLFIK